MIFLEALVRFSKFVLVLGITLTVEEGVSDGKLYYDPIAVAQCAVQYMHSLHQH